MHSRREEHTPSAPSVQPIQTLVADATQPPDDVVLAGKKENDGNLRDRDDTASIPDTLAGELVLQIQAVITQDDKDNNVCQDQGRFTDGRESEHPMLQRDAYGEVGCLAG